jgi:hypothetical protein
MFAVEHYRKEAIRCRQLAAEQPESKHVGRWISLAHNYDLVADALQKRRFEPGLQSQKNPQAPK